MTAMVYITENSFLKIPLYLYGGIYFCLSVGSITVYVLGVYFRLVTMNEILTLKLKNFSFGRILFVDSFNKRQDADVYGALTNIYSEIIDQCDEINVCFGFQLMLAFGLIFCYSLFTSFTVYTDFIDKGKLTTETISSASFCAYFNFFLTVVILTCNLADQEVNSKILFN